MFAQVSYQEGKKAFRYPFLVRLSGSFQITQNSRIEKQGKESTQKDAKAREYAEFPYSFYSTEKKDSESNNRGNRGHDHRFGDMGYRRDNPPVIVRGCSSLIIVLIKNVNAVGASQGQK